MLPPYQINSIAHALDFFGLSQRTVAERTGVSQSEISRKSQCHWSELEYETVVKVFGGIYYDGMEGRFEVNEAQDGMVANVFYVRA